MTNLVFFSRVKKRGANQKRDEIDFHMLESLSTSFRMMEDGGPVMFSFNYGDISEMLARVAAKVSHGGAA